MIAASFEDFRNGAARRLPRFLFDYIDGGANDERTMAANTADLAAVTLRQRVLRDASAQDLAVTLLGETCALPVVLGPVGLAGLAARRGECQALVAAREAGVPFALSTVSVCAVEELAARVGAPFWFQLYVARDRGFVRSMLDRARAAGCRVLVITVDIPVPGRRARDYRSGLAGAPGLCGSVRRLTQALQHPRWCLEVGLGGRPLTLGNVASELGDRSGLQDFLGWTARNFDPSVTWQDLEFVRDAWEGPVVIKGILDPGDARDAVHFGADAVVVSNHGGRQLDGVSSTVHALGPVRDAVEGRATVLADGGVRSGLDVFRMIACGAEGVLLGRMWVYALACGGRTGVARMLELLREDLRVAMALTGAPTIAGIDASLIEQR